MHSLFAAVPVSNAPKQCFGNASLSFASGSTNVMATGANFSCCMMMGVWLHSVSPARQTEYQPVQR